ncbi:hypothetical protein ACLKA7_016520 [Drosophila subpalustris]
MAVDDATRRRWRRQNNKAESLHWAHAIPNIKARRPRHRFLRLPPPLGQQQQQQQRHQQQQQQLLLLLICVLRRIVRRAC